MRLVIQDSPHTGLLEKHGIHVHFWERSERLEQLEAMLPAALTTSMPYIAFKSTKRKEEWLAVRALLQELLGDEGKIIYKDNGKPMLASRASEISISHTQGVVGVALSTCPVGLDIETLSDRAYRLQHYFMKDHEVDFTKVDCPELLATYLWSAKESIYKLVSREGLQLKADITVSVEEFCKEAVVLSATVSDATQRVQACGFICRNAVVTLAWFL